MMTKTNPEQRHPDIEIYLKAITASEVEAWLKKRFSIVSALKQKQQVSYFQVENDGNRIPVMVIEKAAKLYTSVLFESDQTPWVQDIDCAREAFNHFNQEVRCIASGWNEGDEPDEWYSISDRGEEKILWRL
ncbi:MAG: hypothetical protein OQK12_11560 [Motiliproteus sp.]|nr:hypothetical protein [Motiliproteus sp.]MCW9052144.1 hypothetical protein [Motiliproteus sp.]